jgi:hypothetical protein
VTFSEGVQDTAALFSHFVCHEHSCKDILHVFISGKPSQFSFGQRLEGSAEFPVDAGECFLHSVQTGSGGSAEFSVAARECFLHSVQTGSGGSAEFSVDARECFLHSVQTGSGGSPSILCNVYLAAVYWGHEGRGVTLTVITS